MEFVLYFHQIHIKCLLQSFWHRTRFLSGYDLQPRHKLSRGFLLVFCFLSSLWGGNPVVEHHVVLLLCSRLSFKRSQQSRQHYSWRYCLDLYPYVLPFPSLLLMTALALQYPVLGMGVCVCMRSQFLQDLFSQAILRFLVAIWLMESFPSVFRSNDSRWGWAGKHNMLQAVLWHIKPQTPRWHGLAMFILMLPHGLGRGSHCSQ